IAGERLAANVLALRIDYLHGSKFVRGPIEETFLAVVEWLLHRLGFPRLAVGFDVLGDVNGIVVRAVEVDIDAPEGVVHVAFPFAAPVVPAGGADAEGDGTVVLETILDDIAIVGSAEGAAQNEGLAAANLGRINPDDAAIAHLADN